jgi:hypothetical protein
MAICFQPPDVARPCRHIYMRPGISVRTPAVRSLDANDAAGSDQSDFSLRPLISGSRIPASWGLEAVESPYSNLDRSIFFQFPLQGPQSDAEVEGRL